MLSLLFCMSGVGAAKVLPARLIAGDTVGFISPASTLVGKVDITSYKKHVEDLMASLGLKVLFSKNSFTQYGYFSGTDANRSADVMDMFKNPNVKAIIANRGGWGCDRILDLLDYEVIKKNPKILMGYSDLTALLSGITQMTSLVTFHGPMGIDSWGTPALSSDFVKAILFQPKTLTYLNPSSYADWKTITPGKARGILAGGNLAVFTSIIGSNFTQIPSVPYILFLEETEEAPYRVDRMLAQLHLSGWLQAAKGVIFGRCTSCDGSGGWTWQEVVIDHLSKLSTPSYYNALIGHDLPGQFILPLGTEVEMDSTKGSIAMLEPAVK